MSAARKGFYYKRLKAAGVSFDQHYRDYTVDELLAAHEVAVANGLVAEPTAEELAEVERRAHAPRPRKDKRPPDYAQQPQPRLQQEPLDTMPPAPVVQRDPNELPGQRQNSKPLEEPIRVDEQGRVWLQEEVKKPAYPKPRGRRVLRYQDPGTKEETIVSGEYTETFEVSGDPSNATPSIIKITLPSYQVGIYRDPRFPFKVVTYDGRIGFDRIEVEQFYGGAELVPPDCKRVYVENVLCYDVRSVVRAIQTEYRQQQLAGRIQ
jgi:hypothetical protein